MPRIHAALSALLLLLSACLAEPPGVDLEGPRIVSSTLLGPRSVDIPVVPELAVRFSEPIDPGSVHAGSIALIAWELLDQRCELSPICDEGSCTRGRCQADPIRAGDRAALERGEFDASAPEAVPLSFALEASDAGPDTLLHLRPRAPLDAHRRYTLVIAPAVRDRSGAPLVDDYERSVAWQRDFVTAGIGSGGPEPRLVTPAPGQLEVPTNLARVETQLWPPILVVDPSATLALEAEDGSAAVVLVEPQRCPGWVPGTCLRWRPSGALQAGVRYRPIAGTLVDRLGRGVVDPGSSRETWFRAGQGPDLEPPSATLELHGRGRCLAIWIDAGEPVDAALVVAGVQLQRAAIDARGWIGVELDALAPGDVIDVQVELRDLANNESTHAATFEAGASFDPAYPRVRISELLANPSGPEPNGEFVELLAPPEGARIEGALLSDVSAAELAHTWAAGDDPPGDPLPLIELEPGELAIIAGSKWSDAAWAESLPAGVQVIVTDASLGRSGLKNAGEPLTLWVPSELGPVVLASYGNWIDTGAGTHDGRSVVGGPDGCDLPDRWRSHPQGSATPGRLP